MQVWRGEVVSFACGTVAGDQMPRKMECWSRFTMKLQERIEALESMTQVRPGDLAEALCYTGHLSDADWWKRLRKASG